MSETFPDDDSLPHDSYQTRLKAQLKQSGVNDRCHGSVIDGDMGIELKSYFLEAHEGSRSVRCHVILYLTTGC